MKFQSPEAKQKFLGKLREVMPEAVGLLEKPHEVYFVTLGKEDEVILTKSQFKKSWKAIKLTADMFDMRVVVASHKPQYWSLTESGKKLKPKDVEKLFLQEEWNELKELLK